MPTLNLLGGSEISSILNLLISQVADSLVLLPTTTHLTLFQFNTNRLLQPYAYYSQKNIPAEYNYKIYNKEMLAIINYLQEQDTEL